MQEFLQDLPGVIYSYIIRKDNSRGFTYVSNNCADILGVTADELYNDPTLFHKHILQEDLPSYFRSLQKSHSERSSWNWEGRVALNGRIHWIETRSSSTMAGNDNLRKGIVIDITERKQQEIKQELRYQVLIESLPVGIGIYVEGQLAYANTFAHELLKVPPGELIGRNIMEFVHPDYIDLVAERVQTVMAGEEIPVIPQKLINGAGEELDVETTAIPFTYLGKTAVQIIVRDVTEQKRAQRETRRNETFFTQLFSHVPMAVVMLDSNGRVQLVNRGFTEMFGYELEELKDRNLNESIVPDEFRNEGIDINNLITSDRVIKVEAVRKRKDGRLVNVILYGLPVRMDDGIIGIYGVYVDISDHKRMEEELQVRNAELDNFVYKVSHDLRAPLSSILGLVHLAGFRDNTDDPYQYIKLIGEKAERLDAFISDVLSHSKNLKLQIAIEQVDLRSAIERAVADLNYLRGSEEVTFIIESNQSVIYSDPWRIAEIFRNLVSNAVKYRKMEGEKPVVTISIQVNNRQATVVFSDNGIGIEPKSLERVFEMFYRATEQSDGSGIGLYIVKNAVEKLRGKLRVSSEVNVGTTFTIQLPSLETPLPM
jgi:PAS domain S-box-containing protein